MKTCTVCNKSKELTEFGIKKSYHDGLSPWCKLCKSEKDKQNYLLKKEIIKERASYYYKNNKGKVLQRRSNNSEHYKEYNKKYKQDNKSLIKQYNIEYRNKNKESIAEQRQQYRKINRQLLQNYENERMKNDPLFKLSKRLRNRMWDFLQGREFIKDKKLMEYLGCSKEELKKHLESKFNSNMSWDNYGSYWHIDHIIPLASASNEKKIYELCHHENLRPLEASLNWSKNDAVEVCWQKLKRDSLLIKDKEAGFPFDVKARDFTLAAEKFSGEHREFIEKYEWLGTCGFNVKYVFTARHNGLLGGVVLMAEPNAYQFDINLEILIQRGACASWTPKNLASRLIMFSCKWMVENTSKRIFTAYSDPQAGEIGTIYQACNFDYLGDTFGATTQYKLPNGSIVNDRYFKRTSSMKRWAKELGIKWLPEWTKPNGFQNIKEIPKDIRNSLFKHANSLKQQCEKIEKEPKGKYVLLLKNKREKINKIWETKPYPKRK